MKSSFDKSLESYFKNVKDASRSFLEIGSIFGDLSDAMKYGADHKVIIEGLSKIQISFGAKNEELEKEMNCLLQNMKQSKQQLIKLQDSNLIKRLEEQDKNIKNEYALCEKKRNTYETFVKDYQMKNLEFETIIRRLRKEIEYNKKDIEHFTKEIKKYQDMDEYYNEFLKDLSEDSETITKNQETMVKEIEQAQQIAMEELSCRIKMIKDRIFNLHSEIVHLSQLESKIPVNQSESKSFFWFWYSYSYDQKADLSPNRKITYGKMLEQKQAQVNELEQKLFVLVKEQTKQSLECKEHIKMIKREIMKNHENDNLKRAKWYEANNDNLRKKQDKFKKAKTTCQEVKNNSSQHKINLETKK